MSEVIRCKQILSTAATHNLERKEDPFKTYLFFLFPELLLETDITDIFFNNSSVAL